MFNDIQPWNITSPDRIIVIGDVHGDTQRFMKCLYACNIINQNLEWIANPKNTIVVQLGDQIDSLSRGGDSKWESSADIEMIYLTEKLDNIARVNGGRIISLIGNHEYMNVMGEFSYVSEKSKEQLSLNMRKSMFKPGGSLAHILAKRNIIVKIGQHLFCHGGIIPPYFDEVKNIHKINSISQKFLKGLTLTPEELNILQNVILSDSGILWSRLYMDLGQNNIELLDKIIIDLNEVTNTKRICVGHNTVPNITAIANGKLIFVDAGLSRAYPEVISNKMQILEILNPDKDNEIMRIININ